MFVCEKLVVASVVFMSPLWTNKQTNKGPLEVPLEVPLLKRSSRPETVFLFSFQNENTKYIIFTGSGPAISKTITCVEIVKRKMKTLHQITRIFYNR